MSLRSALFLIGFAVVSSGCATYPAHVGPTTKSDPYAKYVWPPPPDEARIRLVEILSGRADVEAGSSLQKTLLGIGPQSAFDNLKKPYAVEFDAKGRILVTDPVLGALFRFDRAGRRLDVLGTTGSLKLAQPLGLGIGPDGSIWVADAVLRKVIEFNPDGDIVGSLGAGDDLVNPTDVAVSRDRTRAFVVDSKAHRVVVFDLKSRRAVGSIGARGEGEAELSFPSSIALDAEGNLFVVDQINARIQVFTTEGEHVDSFGKLGVQPGGFVRPKDIAIDDQGFVYVTDAAFNNVQIFSPEIQLLTFVGGGGEGPGAFQIASGVSVRGDEFAMVDQLGRRVQLFRFLKPKTAD
jgi:DNA-binding beta-propeller fold protein YncE